MPKNKGVELTIIIPCPYNDNVGQTKGGNSLFFQCNGYMGVRASYEIKQLKELRGTFLELCLVRNPGCNWPDEYTEHADNNAYTNYLAFAGKLETSFLFSITKGRKVSAAGGPWRWF